ncbi:hypothetical protein NDI85_19870 [Halomicroarcula sp. S1AR25-4]|uniref:hypothetical protein n=1 Tax=Haloarcula sp. S1AR25-4 TaxID=2950538 RepID=UPI002876EB64|nr:hypothetical protein [Halomicroarcula sp. S1AR25-4]MDS0280046.1 hypothetical protein [Halomicroarcula sp. S1AR25-4]
MSSQQELLSAFDAGDKSDLRLAADTLEDRQRTKAYIRERETGGWRLALVSEDVIWWDDPAGSAKTAKIERSEHGWSGTRRNRSPGPTNEPDLQTAIDEMLDWLQAHPLEAES